MIVSGYSVDFESLAGIVKLFRTDNASTKAALVSMVKVAPADLKTTEATNTAMRMAFLYFG